MYKTVNFLFVLFLSVFLFTSCEKEPILEVSQSSLTFIDQGGTQSISFSTNKDWTASVSGGTGWCTITPASGNSDIKTISVTTVANTTYDDRTATITINAEELSKVITITQPKNRAIILTKDSYEVGTAGGNISVELNSNIEYDVTIPTENQTWITNTTTKGLTTSTLTFAITSNETYDSRKGKIIIKDKTTTLADTVNITQAQKDAIILTQKTFNVADTLIVVSVELKSNTSYMVTIPSAAQLWIKQLQTKALKTESLQFEIARNTAFQARSAEIIILKSLTTLADTLVINQAKAPNIPTTTTFDAYNVTASSVSTGGNVTSDGGGEVLVRGICWSKNDNPTIENSKTANGKGTGTFTTELTGLEPATKYYIRSYAINRTGTGYGNTATFTTLITKPTVTTTAATQITKNSVISGGNVTSTGGGTITQRGVCWGLTENPIITGNNTTNGIGAGEFESSITNLLPATKYYIRAYANNSAGTGYGDNIAITTLNSEPIVETKSFTLSASNIAEIICFISNDGGANVTERGVCWGENENPTTDNNKTNNGVGKGNYSAQISTFTASKTYYIRAYATNSIGTAYGNTITIRTYGEPISDADGNIYTTVKIGTQNWMAENLKTTKYNNGEIIGTTNPPLLNLNNIDNPKFQWAYSGNELNVANYGRLYTGYAILDNRGICPTGWHIPSDSEWEILILYLGGQKVAGEKLKSATAWTWGSGSGNNSSGFNAPPSGIRLQYQESQFDALGNHGYWWSGTSGYGDNLSFRYLGWVDNQVYYSSGTKKYGIAVRCIKD